MNTNFEIRSANEVEELTLNEIECVNGGIGPVAAIFVIKGAAAAGLLYQAYRQNRKTKNGCR